MYLFISDHKLFLNHKLFLKIVFKGYKDYDYYLVGKYIYIFNKAFNLSLKFWSKIIIYMGGALAPTVMEYVISCT